MIRKPDCGFDLYFVKHVLEFLILIYVLYKSGVFLNSYGLWSYSHVLICFSMDKWALCGHFYSFVDPYKGDFARFSLNPESWEKGD